MSPKRRLITDSFKVVKKAWCEEKTERTPSSPEPAPHPQPLTVREMELQELKSFDLDWRFGPCTGISRMQRWGRAEIHGLKPPTHIKQILQSSTDPEYTHCLWRDCPL